MALWLGDTLTGVAAESPKVVERSFLCDFIAVIVVRGLAKCFQHLIWSWMYISKMSFIHWKPPGVSERMWSVNLGASMSGEYQTLGGQSCQPSE
jgi:hypothetical protein